MTLPVETTGLTKSFGDIVAVDNLTFSVERGELFGFIGPDGSGKTTLFRMLTSLLTPDSGRATVLGFDVVGGYREIRKRVGYMPGRFSLYQDLSVEENLEFFAAVFKTSIKENYDLIRDIYSHIEPFKTRRAGQLSGGMKQKLALSCALIHRPDILFLDEPTTGVDAVSRKEFWDMLKGLQEHGISIVVSTPYMDEAGKCDRVALIQTGRLMRVDAPVAIVQSFEWPLYAIKARETYRLIQTLQNQEYTKMVYPFGEYVHYTDSRGVIDQAGLISMLIARGITDVFVKPVEPNIEDCFIHMMEKP